MRNDTPRPTQVKGLDTLLRDGLRLPGEDQGLVMLIKGKPGTGKTTLAVQMALASCQWAEGMPSAVLTFESNTLDIEAKISRMSRSTENMCPLVKPIAVARHVIVGPIESELRSSARWASVILDGLNTLPSDAKVWSGVLEFLRQKSMVGILVLDPSHEIFEHLDYSCDLVIEMMGDQPKEPKDHFFNYLWISKSRFQPSALGLHQYKIRNHGIEVFPSIHFIIHKNATIDEIQEGSVKPIVSRPNVKPTRSLRGKSLIHEILTLDDDVAGEEKRCSLREGTCTVLLGRRNSLKTQLTLDFLRDGSAGPTGGSGALVHLTDTTETVIEQIDTLCSMHCWKEAPLDKRRGCSNRQACYQRVFNLPFRAGCISPSEFLDRFEDFLKGLDQSPSTHVNRLVFWDLAQLPHRYPLLAGESMLLPCLIDHLKRSKRVGGKERAITSVFMGDPDNAIARATAVIADNVIFTWQARRAEQGGVAVYVNRFVGHPGRTKVMFIAHPTSEDPGVPGPDADGPRGRLTPVAVNIGEIEQGPEMLDSIHEWMRSFGNQ